MPMGKVIAALRNSANSETDPGAQALISNNPIVALHQQFVLQRDKPK